MKKKFESTLPHGYTQVKHLNARSARLGLLLNLVALLVLVVVMAVAIVPLAVHEVAFEPEPKPLLLATVVFTAATFAYIVLHELVHGAAYKALTGEKLTFGLSWSCAFCGVPEIYTYRRTALIAVTAPLLVFTLLLLPLTAALYFVHPIYYLASALLLGLHLGGCCGDLYVLLLLFKYRTERLLMRDTGPEQYFYIPED